jgi:hypothetical protein
LLVVWGENIQHFGILGVFAQIYHKSMLRFSFRVSWFALLVCAPCVDVFATASVVAGCIVARNTPRACIVRGGRRARDATGIAAVA